MENIKFEYEIYEGNLILYSRVNRFLGNAGPTVDNIKPILKPRSQIVMEGDLEKDLRFAVLRADTENSGMPSGNFSYEAKDLHSDKVIKGVFERNPL